MRGEGEGDQKINLIVISCTKYFRMLAPAEGLRHRMGLDLGSLYGKKTEKKPREPRNVVILDVGGERFSATRATLLNYPASRLGKLMRAETIEKILEQCDEFVPGMVVTFQSQFVIYISRQHSGVFLRQGQLQSEGTIDKST